MNAPAPANSRERIADPEERAEAEALANRKVSGWEAHWGRLLEKDRRWMAGETYAQDVELRSRPVMPESQTQRVDNGRPDAELSSIVRADRINAVEQAILQLGMRHLEMWRDATLHGLTASQIAERRLGSVSVQTMRVVLGADNKASKRDLNTRFVRGWIEACGEAAADALEGRL